MAGLRGLHGDFGGFQVADFANHDDVGILPQDRAQGAGKGKPGTRVDMHLIDPRQRVFDRILNSHDIYCRLTQHIETRVERRTLPGTGGPGNQQHALRQRKTLRNTIGNIPREAQIGKAKQWRGGLQKPHDNFFAELRRQSRNAHVHLACATATMNRPSWGARRSPMSMSERILMRETSEFCSVRGTFSSSRSTPSTRMRTTVIAACGSI